MILTEKKSLIEIRNSIEKRLAERYTALFNVNDKKCFVYGKDCYFIISALTWKKSGESVILAEYADSLDEAKKHLFGEDGELFYVDEMTEDEIYEAIVNEIEE